MNRYTWVEVWRLFHKLWGKAADGMYDKETWIQLQSILQNAEAADRQSSKPPNEVLS